MTLHGIVGLHIRTRVRAKLTVHCRLFSYKTRTVYLDEWTESRNLLPGVYGAYGFDGKFLKLKYHDPGSLCAHQFHYWGDQGLLHRFGVKFQSFALSDLLGWSNFHDAFEEVAILCNVCSKGALCLNQMNLIVS